MEPAPMTTNPDPAVEAAPGKLPQFQEEVLAMVDGGGTNFRLFVYNQSGEVIFEKSYETTKFPSLSHGLRMAFREAYRVVGVVPKRVAFALAGPADEEAGIVELTNPPPWWPAFDLNRFMELTGCRGRLFNDMEVQAADAINTERGQLYVLRPGHVWLEGKVLLLNSGTGLGTGSAKGGVTVNLEGGHLAIPPQTPEEADCMEWVRLLNGQTYASAEMLLSGRHGYRNLIAWLRHNGMQPDPLTSSLLEGLPEHKGPGRIIDQRVGHDPFADTIIRVMGGMCGTWIRMMMTEHQPTGGVHLVGSVFQASAELFANRSPFLERVNDPNLPHHNRVRTFEVAINRDKGLTIRGGFILAQQV